MDMNRLILFFYRLPMECICQAFVLVTLAGVILLRRYRHRRWLRPGLLCTGALWAAAVVYITILSRSETTVQAPNLVPLHSYLELLRGGTPELIRTNFMNIALFYPAGVLSAALLPQRRRVWPAAALLFLCFSAGIELYQYHFALGTPEIDDVIHNTLGVMLGWLCFRVFLKDTEHPS